MATKYNLSVKVSEKGAVQIMGMGRWPVTLYKDQMEALLDRKEGILAFIKANVGRLSTKEDAPAKEGTAKL